MVPHPAENGAQGGEVLAAHRLEQHLPHAFDMPRKHVGDQLSAGAGDCHDDAALVIRRRRAGDQAALVQQPRLVSQPAAAVHDTVGQIGHP
jgi:hypothetical protein